MAGTAPSRLDSHAGSWYTSNGSKLDEQLSDWLNRVNGNDFPSPWDIAQPEEEQDSDAVDSTDPSSPRRLGQMSLPITNLRAIISPHAGYSYSGPCAAWSYKCIPSDQYKRIFILGPSHHYYLNGCALSKCKEYSTPLGALPIDVDTVKELSKEKLFSWMTQSQDEDEHSIEMQLPYLRKVFQGRQDVKVVPILVGSIDFKKEDQVGEILAPYLADRENLFVISSDFCHWGTRFQYTYYNSPSSTSIRKLDPSTPIYKSIQSLDSRGIQSIQFPHCIYSSKKSIETARKDFKAYLDETSNTICGRHPIGVLLAALAHLEKEDIITCTGGESGGAECRFVRYEQSSQCTSPRDSSVSYAAGYVMF
ncbi:unnamed protein product [Sympodiomycopsis kandeliae]